MQTKQIANQTVTFHRYNTVVVGSGAAGMNCAVHLYEFMTQKQIKDAQKRIAVVTAGLGLGTSRMSGSDKQTYYKIGTSPDVPDSAESFAQSLTAAGCCHGDLALAEAIGSLREFYHLVQAGVPFPHDPMGSYVGYKTDHDPFERATSAGPKTSKFMSECLEKQVRRYGISIHDHREVGHFLTAGEGKSKRIIGVVTVDTRRLTRSNYAVVVYLCKNLVLAAGGPGELYETSVYPKDQTGIHGLAFKAGLIGENLTESQFGMASTKFRWNVSGSYCQAIPRIFSTDSAGNDHREFLTRFFPTMRKLATNIFLKGYQWPFNPQRIENLGSSLIDILVFKETQRGRRVFMDFRQNPAGSASMGPFSVDDLEPEARDYLEQADALKGRPIERLFALNPPAIEIYTENGIDLWSEPLEIAVCAQHNNGGFAVDRWWRSNISNTFVIGEMAGTHGVKRPGGSALNAGQTGGLRAAEYVANVEDLEIADLAGAEAESERQLSEFVVKLDSSNASSALVASDVISGIQRRMSTFAAHIRELGAVGQALGDAIELCGRIQREGFRVRSGQDVAAAIRAEHLAFTSVAYLKAIKEFLERGGGSRGSFLVLDPGGVPIHSDILDEATGQPMKFKPENEELRKTILQVKYDPQVDDLFVCEEVAVRKAPTDRKAFELAWQDYREGQIYKC